MLFGSVEFIEGELGFSIEKLDVEQRKEVCPIAYSTWL